MLLTDQVVLAGAWLLAGWVRWGGWPEGIHWLPLLVQAPVAVAVFELCGAYSVLYRIDVRSWIGRAVAGLVLTQGVLLLAAYVVKASDQFSRAVTVGALATSLALVPAARLLLHEWLVRRLRTGPGGSSGERVVLAGTPAACAVFRAHCLAHRDAGLYAVGMASAEVPAGAPDWPVRPLAEVAQAARDWRAERVVICGPVGDDRLVPAVLEALAGTALPVSYAPDPSGMASFAFRIGDCAGRPILELLTSPLDERAERLKWLEDRLLAPVLLALAAPVMLLVAVLVKLTSRGPVLFVQERHGLLGRPIRVLKFRTMRSDAGADRRLAAPGDARITPLGRWLRRTSLDELPQLLNVVRGDMSLVGPRPQAVWVNERFAGVPRLMQRHFVKPGITGLAQTSGARGLTRDAAAMAARLDLDLRYARRWSLWLDLRLLGRTLIQGFWNREP